jgi:hypothetical protein
MEFVRNSLMNSVSFYGLAKTGVIGTLEDEQNYMLKHLKRGFLFYIANEGQKYVFNSADKSNFIRQDMRDLIDDTVFLGISSAVLEMADIPSKVKPLIPQIGDVDMTNAIGSGVLLEMINLGGHMIEGKGGMLETVRHSSRVMNNTFVFNQN